MHALGVADVAGAGAAVALRSGRPARCSASTSPRATSSRCRSRCRTSSAALRPTPTSRATSPRSSPPISSAPACSRRSIRRPTSRRSPTSTRCRAFPTGAPSTRRRWSPAASPPGRRAAQGRVPAVGRVRRPAARRPAIFHHARQLAAHRPHHLGRDLRAAHRREGLFRQPRRVRRRDRPEGAPHQAARHHGSGRRQRALPHARRRPRADAALLAVDAGDHLHVLRPGRAAGLSAQHRDRPARDRRQFPRHDVRAALLARRPARDHEPAAGRQLQPLRHGSALEGDDAADRHAGDRHRAVLFAGRHAHLLRVRSRRQPADLRHGRGGGAAQRISFGEGTYSTPVWSPRGDYIAFTKQAGASSPSA